MDNLNKTLHWLLALLIFAQIGLGYESLHSLWFMRHEATVLSAHRQLGVLVFFVAAALFVLRTASGRPIKLNAAFCVHTLMYLLILGETALGLWIAGLFGMQLTFGPLHIPILIPADPRLAYSASLLQIHLYIAYGIAFLIVGHVGAALYHHLVMRDDVLRNMLIKPAPKVQN